MTKANRVLAKCSTKGCSASMTGIPIGEGKYHIVGCLVHSHTIQSEVTQKGFSSRKRALAFMAQPENESRTYIRSGKKDGRKIWLCTERKKKMAKKDRKNHQDCPVHISLVPALKKKRGPNDVWILYGTFECNHSRSLKHERVPVTERKRVLEEIKLGVPSRIVKLKAKLQDEIVKGQVYRPMGGKYYDTFYLMSKYSYKSNHRSVH